LAYNKSMKTLKRIRSKISNLVKTYQFRLMIFFIRRYADTDMDQWDRIETPSKFGNLYIEISRQSDGYNYRSVPEKVQA
jgi:hypothetical protein